MSTDNGTKEALTKAELKKQMTATKESFEATYKHALGDRPLSELSEPEKYRIDSATTRVLLDKGIDKTVVTEALQKMAAKGRDIKEPAEEYAKKVVDKSIEFNKQKYRDIKVCTQTAAMFCDYGHDADSRKKVGTLLERTSPNMTRFGRDEQGNKERDEYVKSITGRSLDLAKDQKEERERWQGIYKAPAENAERDPVKAYQIAARVSRQAGEKTAEIDIFAGKKMANDGYAKEDIEKALGKASPFAVGRASAYSKETVKTLEKDVPLKTQNRGMEKAV